MSQISASNVRSWPLPFIVVAVVLGLVGWWYGGTWGLLVAFAVLSVPFRWLQRSAGRTREHRGGFVLMSLSRVRRTAATIAVLLIAGHSLVPPWRAYRVRPGSAVVSWPLGSYAVFSPPPPPPSYSSVGVDYGRLALYYVGTVALLAPFFLWPSRRSSSPRQPQHGTDVQDQRGGP
jgi:hypothetical protein